jgi:hypothetical protein
MTHLVRAAVALGCVAVGQTLSAPAQGPPSAGMPTQTHGEVKTMTEEQRGKLDAFLKQAVADKRPEPLSVMIRIAAEEGADARVGEVLTKLGLKASRTLSGGRLLVVTLKAEQLPDIVASADVARVSYDAVVTPQAR